MKSPSSAARCPGFEDYNPPFDLSGCGRSGFQSAIRVVVMNDTFGGHDPVCDGQGEYPPDLICDDSMYECFANDNCCQPGCTPDPAPETWPPFHRAHSLGHILFARWVCLEQGEWGLSSCPTGGHAWRRIESEHCTTNEGFSEFTHVASLWDQDAAPSGGVLALATHTGVRQAELIGPVPAAPDAGFSGRRACECDNGAGCEGFTSPYLPQMSDSAPTRFFWDVYDTNEDDSLNDGCGTRGCDDVSMSLEDIFDVWSDFDDGWACNSSENEDREDWDCNGGMGGGDEECRDADKGCHLASGCDPDRYEECNARNIWDFHDVASHTWDLTNLAVQNCVDTSDQS